jgi:hypothetical protein
LVAPLAVRWWGLLLPDGVDEEDEDEEDLAMSALRSASEWALPPLLLVREETDGAAAADERERFLKCVSRCCFMLSERVNFFAQPSKVQHTPFSAV